MMMRTEENTTSVQSSQTDTSNTEGGRPQTSAHALSISKAGQTGTGSNNSSPPKKVNLPQNTRGTILAGGMIIGVTFLGFGVWAAYAPLASAVAAPASVISQGRQKTVQHLEGGIVSEIFVHEGDKVEQGEVLFRLDSVQAKSRVKRLQTQLYSWKIRRARLIAERDGREAILFSKDISKNSSAEVEEVIESEKRLFNERKKSLNGQIKLLDAKIRQLMLKVDGLDAQKKSTTEQINFLDSEIDSLGPLLEKGLVTQTRSLSLKRESSRLSGETGDIVAQRASANEEASSARLEKVQLRQKFREQVVTDLRDAETQINDLNEQFIAARDVLNRLDIIAPASGIAQSVAITTRGAVIQPGEPLLEIAPAEAHLVIAAQVSPISVHDLHVGQKAQVRFVALDLRRLPDVFGTVETISGDRIVDKDSGKDYFLVQVTISPDELTKLGHQEVHPGMPAQIIVQTGMRTFADYLIRPLEDAITNGLNEK